MFVPWATFVLRVVRHLNPVQLAASFQSLELPLHRTATPAPQGNTASDLEAQSPQVGGLYQDSQTVKDELKEYRGQVV